MCAYVCVHMHTQKGSMQTFNSEYLGMNWLVEKRGSRKTSILGLHTFQCFDFHKYISSFSNITEIKIQAHKTVECLR